MLTVYLLAMILPRFVAITLFDAMTRCPGLPVPATPTAITYVIFLVSSEPGGWLQIRVVRSRLARSKASSDLLDKGRLAQTAPLKHRRVLAALDPLIEDRLYRKIRALVVLRRRYYEVLAIFPLLVGAGLRNASQSFLPVRTRISSREIASQPEQTHFRSERA